MKDVEKIKKVTLVVSAPSNTDFDDDGEEIRVECPLEKET